LANRHCGQNINENERAIREVVAIQIAMRETANERDGLEWQLGHNTALEDGVEQAEKGHKHEADHHH